MSRSRHRERSILPVFMRLHDARRRWAGRTLPRLALPPIPLIDQYGSCGVLLVELARVAEASAR